MIPFHLIYTWLFKSFNISGDSVLIERLIAEGYQSIMIIKRSWVFALITLWMPLSILILSVVSVFIAYDSIDIHVIRYTLIVGNILMALILIISSVNYIRHFRSIHHTPHIITDMHVIREETELGNQYFESFFNWSITNQWILILIIAIEISLIFLYGERIGPHFWVLATDTLVILLEIIFLRLYRKRMMDLEMDYNIVVEDKVFFVNQSGLLSSVQTIDGSKIKTVQSTFPSKIASLFNYGTINILTVGDSTLIGTTMSMQYVTDPDTVVAHIQTLINQEKRVPQSQIRSAPQKSKPMLTKHVELQNHTVDTRAQIRDILN